MVDLVSCLDEALFQELQVCWVRLISLFRERKELRKLFQKQKQILFIVLLLVESAEDLLARIFEGFCGLVCVCGLLFQAVNL